ncbi:MAG: DUF6786 family protein [Candidatus Hydrogenedentales bacterium]
MLSILRKSDTELTELVCGPGSVLVCPGLQGRIFCQLEDELMHRLDVSTLASPSLTDFNNLGGNSLWPAPEGGPFGFNYLPGSDQWLVQPGINLVPAIIVQTDARKAVIEKRIDLTNRKGCRLDLVWRRAVEVPASWRHANDYRLAGLTYRSEDTFSPSGTYGPSDVLLAPWSLEQFPGAEGVIAFGKVRDSESAINYDFYGQPGERIAWEEGVFTFALGGEDRHQIGISVASSPELIGALDTKRSVLILRRTAPTNGTYFNIADNDQPQGPYSAADLYSIFNGGALDFFELETIGAMQLADGALAASALISETTILKGDTKELHRYLSEQEGISIDRR